ncbi:MAG: [FeFe] hydrogenase, group A [Planctomycetota bacterium]|jgi:NADH-quinone oxidoreductase subunit G/NADP-reducing hydrogenase subunit HndD|nr:[FeFe] hydrogenase, group A [Planctomycetota bacterium]
MSKKKFNEGKPAVEPAEDKKTEDRNAEARPADKPVEPGAAAENAMAVDGHAVGIQPGDTILIAAQRAGIHIPTLCYLEGFSATGSCRFCVVEIEGRPALVPSCTYPAEPGLKVQTHSARVVEARRTIIGLLLADHPGDCLACVRSDSCRLQELASELDVRQRRSYTARPHHELDTASPSIVRETSKCVLCGKCIRVCEDVQGVSAIGFIGRGAETIVGTVFNQGMNVSSCINCGQCTLVCPTGALHEQRDLTRVVAALRDPAKVAVVQHAPSVSVSIGELAGLRPGEDVDGPMVTALRRLGFKYVFDTSFSADLTIMEEASEFVHRVSHGGILPMFTSCSPAWIKFVETFYPEFMPNLSTCKSPQAMMGAVIKSYWAKRMNLDPADIVSVSIMPCTAKKFEAARPEMGRDGVRDVDAVLTTRELARLLKQHNLNLRDLEPGSPDSPFGERSTAGKIFGASGGVMEAALRTAYNLITGGDAESLDFKEIRGQAGSKEYRINVAGIDVGVAVVNSLSNARKILEQIKNGRSDLHFIEVMSCPGGCVGGGGQPLSPSKSDIKVRLDKLYDIDRSETANHRMSHRNQEIRQLYDDFLGSPLGPMSHELLHTHYHARPVAR